MPATGLTDLMSAPAEPSIDMPEVDSDADEPVPDASPVADVSAVDDVRVVNDDRGDVAGVDDASPALGTAAPSGADIAVVSGATVCALVPAGVAAACPTAAACPANPAGAVLGSGGVNGVNVDAVCEAAA
jgi:hypothetical protein